MIFQIMPTCKNLESQSEVSKVLQWSHLQICVCGHQHAIYEYLMLTAYMQNIVSQLYNVEFQNLSEHSTAVLPLHFIQLSYLLLPARIYGPVSLLRGFQRLNFHSPDRIALS